MPHRLQRFLMPWFLVALQAMTPFIHAHAGAVELNHAGFLHVHQNAHTDAVWHVVAADERGAEVEVEQGMPLRHDSHISIADAPPVAAGPALPQIEETKRPGAGLPAPIPLRLALPDHLLPQALAPPAA
ncbi:MAG: hypothetical protein MUE59_09615 [Thiobacillaceae bacterium]|jgi:hypothetical protein|nr:hypothetical protein [Thiobacillaceae bacterium]